MTINLSYFTRSRIITVLSLIAVLALSVANDVGQTSAALGTGLMITAAVAAAAGGALTRTSGASRSLTIIGLGVAVFGALAEHAHKLPDNIGSIVLLLGSVAAALGKSLFATRGALPPSVVEDSVPSLDEHTDTQTDFLTPVLACVLGLSLLTGGACAKRRLDESPAAFEARKQAIYVLQTVTALDGVGELVEILHDGEVIEAQAARAVVENLSAALSVADIARDHLLRGRKGDAISELKRGIEIVTTLQQGGILKIKSPRGRQLFEQATVTALLTLNSLQAVLEARSEPEAEIRQAVRRARTLAEADGNVGGNFAWYNQAVLLAQETFLKLFEQSRYESGRAWNEAATTITEAQTRNRIRLEAWARV